MRAAGLTGSMVVALVIAVGCGLAAGAADALPVAGPVAGKGGAAEAVAPLVQRATHQPNRWHWDGGWWRHGPWAGHGIHGFVIVRPWTSPVFVPWGAERLRYCAATYRSFDPATGTYVTRGGQRRICR